MHYNITESKFNLPSINIISIETTEEGTFFFSQYAKNPSAPLIKNRAQTTLEAIKLGIEKGSQFTCETDFGTERISDVAQAIYARYERRYNESWQSIFDKFIYCCGGKSDLEKMHDLLAEILRHSGKLENIESTSIHSEDGSSVSLSEDSTSLGDSEISDGHVTLTPRNDLTPQLTKTADLTPHIMNIEDEDTEVKFIYNAITNASKGSDAYVPASTLSKLENLTGPQVQLLVESIEAENSLEKTLNFLNNAALSTQGNSIYFPLIQALHQRIPESPHWDAFQNNSQLTIPITALKTISILNLPLQPSISEDDQKKLVDKIRLSFAPIFTWGLFEEYIHTILSHIITLNSIEGSAIAQMKLKIFTIAIMPNKEDGRGDFMLHIFKLVSRAVHLDQDPISKCCKHLPITPDFRLTPFILKTLIAEHAKNQSKWNYFVMHHIDTKEQAFALIEAALELPEYQQKILLSAIYQCLQTYPRSVLNRQRQALFQEKGLNPEDYPSLPEKNYNRLFMPPVEVGELSDESIS